VPTVGHSGRGGERQLPDHFEVGPERLHGIHGFTVFGAGSQPEGKLLFILLADGIRAQAGNPGYCLVLHGPLQGVICRTSAHFLLTNPFPFYRVYATETLQARNPSTLFPIT
jgi:hypothetical protein